jgi:hypothetical protein
MDSIDDLFNGPFFWILMAIICVFNVITCIITPFLLIVSGLFMLVLKFIQPMVMNAFGFNSDNDDEETDVESTWGIKEILNFVYDKIGLVKNNAKGDINFTYAALIVSLLAKVFSYLGLVNGILKRTFGQAFPTWKIWAFTAGICAGIFTGGFGIIFQATDNTDFCVFLDAIAGSFAVISTILGLIGTVMGSLPGRVLSFGGFILGLISIGLLVTKYSC